MSSAMDQILVNRNKTFWLFQIVGWLGYSLLRSFISIVSNNTDIGYVGFILLATVVGLILTTVLRYGYRQLRTWPITIALSLVVLVSVIAGLVISAIEIFALPYLVDGVAPYEGLARFTNAGFETMVILAWSACYFGYHYYEGFQAEKERALKATALAHEAQLKMLRYQLNPHFLFNTLNAISTLVLENAGSEANSMLTKLSSFLRYTLVNQPTQKVTLDQEIYTLQLYLDIEKVRFQDRLIVEYAIDDDARTVLIPSLILQPLIENSIKYAIAPAENGGTLKITAKTKNNGRRICLALQDTGPGIPDIENIRSQTGSGVGIANTRERLAQLYGSDHRILLENIEPEGLSVMLEFPAEHLEPRGLRRSSLMDRVGTG